MGKEGARRGLRLHIGIFGRRNVGKSSLLNAVTRQESSIVSEISGTTTDPVEKPMELLPLGPVLFIDTAGIDDEGALGEKRIAKTRRVIDRTDVALIVSDKAWGSFEEALFSEFNSRSVPVIVVLNKIDLWTPAPELLQRFTGHNICVVQAVAKQSRGVQELRRAIINSLPAEFLREPDLIGDLVPPGKIALLVVPIDKEAPRGRLIAPQVQTIRNLLDGDAIAVVTKERELAYALSTLKEDPALVVTDSQVFLKVAADVPARIPMTSFSILLARHQGDLVEMVRGALAIENLKTGDRILVAESCTHHPIAEDIGSVKIPRWLTQYVGGKLEFTQVQGRDFPEDLSTYALVVHCGACMTNRREVLSRIMHCRAAGVPITNYGLAIAYSLGIFKRALEPFPAACELLNDS